MVNLARNAQVVYYTICFKLSHESYDLKQYYHLDFEPGEIYVKKMKQHQSHKYKCQHQNLPSGLLTSGLSCCYSVAPLVFRSPIPFPSPCVLPKHSYSSWTLLPCSGSPFISFPTLCWGAPRKPPFCFPPQALLDSHPWLNTPQIKLPFSQVASSLGFHLYCWEPHLQNSISLLTLLSFSSDTNIKLAVKPWRHRHLSNSQPSIRLYVQFQTLLNSHLDEGRNRQLLPLGSHILLIHCTLSFLLCITLGSNFPKHRQNHLWTFKTAFKAPYDPAPSPTPPTTSSPQRSELLSIS